MMYIPPAFEKSNLTTLHDFIERNSFGVLISQVDGQPFATHLPFLLERTAGKLGTLVGHAARANSQCLAVGDQTILAIFSGPHSYVSPSWYASENVVPTWNYVAVHAFGKMQLVEEKKALTDIVGAMTSHYERNMPMPWKFDGTTTFADRLLSQIVGFRIEIEKIEGKWKLSQNQPVERQEKVINALEVRSDENSQAVASLMRERQK